MEIDPGPMANSQNACSTNWPSPFLTKSLSARETSREIRLYNGVSNRSRGWKSRTCSDAMEGRIPRGSNIRRWDGIARTCVPWDSLRRDPELWYCSGNCFVHLYGKGESRIGPAFKVPFGMLLAARCHPLVERSLCRNLCRSSTGEMPGEDSLAYWNCANPGGRIDLYIPAPQTASQGEALQYHLATRNLFAWVFGRPVVGEHLGSALVSLLGSMDESRCVGEDNRGDILSYLHDMGYFNLPNQPMHALAMLHLAERCQLRELYIDASTHCAGMSDRLYAFPEYQVISAVSQKCIKRAKLEMNLKLGRAGVMLRNFLEDDFSEAHIGLTAGGRAHLECFRAFLFSFFVGRFGYYPPSSTDPESLIFEPQVYQTLRDDFGALYEYMVDESFTTSESSPPLAQGGICTLQNVHGFDLRNKFLSLPHPLPLLPEVASTADSRRRSWLCSSDKIRQDQQVVAHTALVRATNQGKIGLMDNELVRAYSRFEEDTVFSPRKTDRLEKVSQVDARKIRWILIYALYQVVRSCTDAPQECHDVRGVRYSTCISTEGLPPWERSRQTMRTAKGRRDLHVSTAYNYALPPMPISTPAPTTLGWSSLQSASGLEIKPDIDYFALTHSTPDTQPASSTIPSRTRSLNRTLRRSLTIFGNSPVQELPAASKAQQTAYHEVLVHGYGHDTDDALLEKKNAQPKRTVQPPDPPIRTSSLRHFRDSLSLRSPSSLSTASAVSSSVSSASTHTHKSTGSTASSIESSCSSSSNSSLSRDKLVSRSGSNSLSSSPSPPIPPISEVSRRRRTVDFATVTTTVPDSPPPPEIPQRDIRRELDTLRICEEARQAVLDAWAAARLDSCGEGAGAEDVWAPFAHVGGLTELSRKTARAPKRLSLPLMGS